MKTVWYKEPWAWFVFILPFSAVVAGISTFIIANTDADPLVVGDYYKKGKAINLELSKIKLAQKLGLKFELQTTSDELIIKPTGIDKNFPMLNAKFYHSTLEKRDFEVRLTPDANGNFRTPINHNISGKWQITLTTFNADWKIENKLSLPQSSFVPIEPKLSEGN